MSLDIDQLIDSARIVAAAETEDEIGTTLRMHLVFERVLVWFIEHKRPEEISSFLTVPWDFGGKIQLAAAFGLPIEFLRVIRCVNKIRNELAHRGDALESDQIKELVRQTDKIIYINADFIPVARRFLELPVVRPGERMIFGRCGPRVDFVIATMAFLQAFSSWAVTKVEANQVSN